MGKEIYGLNENGRPVESFRMDTLLLASLLAWREIKFIEPILMAVAAVAETRKEIHQ